MKRFALTTILCLGVIAAHAASTAAPSNTTVERKQTTTVERDNGDYGDWGLLGLLGLAGLAGLIRRNRRDDTTARY